MKSAVFLTYLSPHTEQFLDLQFVNNKADIFYRFSLNEQRKSFGWQERSDKFTFKEDYSDFKINDYDSAHIWGYDSMGKNLMKSCHKEGVKYSMYFESQGVSIWNKLRGVSYSKPLFLCILIIYQMWLFRYFWFASQIFVFGTPKGLLKLFRKVQTIPYSAHSISDWLKPNNLKTDKVILFNTSSRKGVHRYVDTLSESFSCTVVGEEINKSNVINTGFLENHSLISLYTDKILVLCSDFEGWGFVVNEAVYNRSVGVYIKSDLPIAAYLREFVCPTTTYFAETKFNYFANNKSLAYYLSKEWVKKRIS